MIQVIKIGGGVLENEAQRNAFLRQFAAIEGPKVLVHGGGRLATTMAERMGIETHMIDGRRVTDKETLDIVTMVYGGLINKQVVAQLQTMGVNAIGLTGVDGGWMKAVKRPLKNGIDYGFVGDVIAVNGNHIRMLLDNGLTPVIAPITFSAEGWLLNTNADTIASSVAIALAGHKYRNRWEVCSACENCTHCSDDGRLTHEVELIYCFEKDGVLYDKDDDASVIGEIDREKFADLKEQGVVADGMIPKLTNSFKAIDSGVSRVIIKHARNLLNEKGTTLK
jgi:acetylglutamate kinase